MIPDISAPVPEAAGRPASSVAVLGADAARPPAIELRHIDKSFGAVRANRDVSLSIAAGTIHGIIGENGAGKSTLMSILYGFYQAERGEILIHGVPRRILRPAEAIAAGIGMVFQHFKLVENMTVLENIVLGAEGGKLIGPALARARADLVRLARDYALEVEPDALIETLPVGLQQRVEILKALIRGAEILILDEPTGVLTPQEADHLFRVLAALRAQGKTILLITHKLREIMAATDHVTVMRRGEVVASRATAATSREELAELMVGRKVLLDVTKGPQLPGPPLLEVEHLSVVDAGGVERVRDVSFIVRGGEILGIAGVAGNGQSELLEALAGIRRPRSGAIRVSAAAVAPGAGGRELRQRKLAHVPEDRRRMGLVTAFAAHELAILGYHRDTAFTGPFLMDRRAIIANCERQMAAYDVRPPDPMLASESFSGGNQQKLVLAREIERDPDVLLVGQPTRGVDIGAIEFIHKKLIALRDAGKAVLLISVELDEILSLADRILVMFEGRVVGQVAAGQADERLLGLMMAGIDPRHAERAHA